MQTEEDFVREFYNKGFSSAESCLYAVLDKVTASEDDRNSIEYAGVISLSATDTLNASTEIGVIIFPKFQRTHVATNAIGLMLMWTLDPPSSEGLGLRRVEWRTHAENMASKNVALRMGFELEGILRWHRVFPGGTLSLPLEGLEKRNGTKGELPGRHTAIFSIVWEEWDEKRPRIVVLMERKVITSI
jgi:RimJ/RimL family protein N-acetyltransferase